MKPPLLMGSRWVPPRGAAGHGAVTPPDSSDRSARCGENAVEGMGERGGRYGTSLPALTLSRQFTFSVGYTIFPQRAQLGFMAAPLPPPPPPRPPLGRRPRAAPLNTGGGGREEGRRGRAGRGGGARPPTRIAPPPSRALPHSFARALCRPPQCAQIAAAAAAPYTHPLPPSLHAHAHPAGARPLCTTLRAGTRTRLAP